MGNFNDYELMNSSFLIHYRVNLGCWRGCRRWFCNERKNTILPDSNRNGNNLSNNTPVVSVLYTKQLIISKDFNKGIIAYDSSVSIIDKIFAFQIHKSGKYIDLTKNFLTDPKFLKFAYYQVRKDKGAYKELDCINDKWFEKTALRIKNATYKFKPAKEVSIPKPHKVFNRVLTVINGRDRIIQKAMAILLEMIYENNGYFHDESHGFRPNKGCHTALHQIKMGWHSIPYYIVTDINKAFDNINHNILINILKETISDKRFIDMLNKMYNVNTLCPENFWIRKK